MFSAFQVPPSPSPPASTRRCPRAPSPTSRTSLPATSTSRRRGSSGRRCPSKTSSLGRPSQLGELEKFDWEKRGTTCCQRDRTDESHASAQRHCCPLLTSVAQCCLLEKSLLRQPLAHSSPIHPHYHPTNPNN